MTIASAVCFVPLMYATQESPPLAASDTAVITTATTAVGVVPMMLGGSTFWAPVGITIFAGGIGSLILVVTILPVLYSKIYK